MAAVEGRWWRGGLSIGAAAQLSLTLHDAGKLQWVDGGFAGMAATLGFLYLSAVTLIYGAESNAVLAQDDAPPPRAAAAG